MSPSHTSHSRAVCREAGEEALAAPVIEGGALQTSPSSLERNGTCWATIVSKEFPAAFEIVILCCNRIGVSLYLPSLPLRKLVVTHGDWRSVNCLPP